MDNVILKTKIDVYQDQLKKNKKVRIKVTGNSMLPFLKNGEVIVVEPVTVKNLFPGDVALTYIQGSVFCHRVFKNNGRVFQTKGDALTLLDPPATEENLIGKATARVVGLRNMKLARITGFLISRMSIIAAYVYIPLRFIKRIFKKVIIGEVIRDENTHPKQGQRDK
ncbi:MAG: hypothetical protein GY853_12940 [PVC group bacterium]|nr:hypothetical protein [PVC group bacterium]